MLEKIINTTIKYIILFFVFSVSLYMLVNSFFTTNDRSHNNEIVLDNVLVHILVIAAVMAVGVVLLWLCRQCAVRWGFTWRISPGVVTAVVVCLVGLAWCGFIYMMGYDSLGGDPKAVYVAVQTLFDGTYAGFDVGGYCYLYTNNNGIAMYMYYLLKAGITTIGLQYLNVVYWMVSMLLMYRILRLMDVRSVVCALATIAFSLCIPYGMYVTYVYGVIPGIMLVLASFYFLIKWYKLTDNAALAPRWSFLCIWASIMCMALACVLKQNYLIMAVSLAICMVAMFTRRKRWLMLVYCIVLFVGYAGCALLVNAAIEGVTGLKVSKGIPRLSWVAMGLRWEEENWPGEFDYWPNWAYYKVGYDNEKMEQLSREQVKYRIKYYLSHKRDGVRFFYKKINAQWNEPTYECFVVQATESHWEGGSRLAGIMGEGSFVRIAYEWLANEMQTMMWLGMVLLILLCHKKMDVVCLFAATGFVGGFMFHIVWETASRYAITYVVLLIPYAVIGFVECAKWLDGKWRMAWEKLIRS